jgi:hypothetical protein
MTDEERFEYLGKVNEEATFDLDADKFMTEQLGDNEYLLWVTSSSYGKESGEFGSCRPCNQIEIYNHAPKFREILGEIDTKKLKYIDYCYYNSTECTVDYYLGEEEITEVKGIQAAIDHFQQQAPRNCGVMYEQYTAVAEWLQELASYKDKTYIEPNFLTRNGFEKREYDYLYCDDAVEISAQCIDDEAGVWRIEIAYLDSGYPQTLDICTVGQLRMFLVICGLDNIVEFFK